MSFYAIVHAEARHVGVLARLSGALFAEDAGVRDPLTDQGWPGEHGRGHFSDLIARDDAVCFLAFSGQTPVGYLAGLMQHPTAVRPIGFALALGVAMDAFLIRTTFIPATMYLLGEKAWYWPFGAKEGGTQEESPKHVAQ